MPRLDHHHHDCYDLVTWIAFDFCLSLYSSSRFSYECPLSERVAMWWYSCRKVVSTTVARVDCVNSSQIELFRKNQCVTFDLTHLAECDHAIDSAPRRLISHCQTSTVPCARHVSSRFLLRWVSRSPTDSDSILPLWVIAPGRVDANSRLGRLSICNCSLLLCLLKLK